VVDVERGEHVHKHVVVKGQIEQGLLAKAAAGGGGHGRKEEREEDEATGWTLRRPVALGPVAQKDGECEQCVNASCVISTTRRHARLFVETHAST
jgi:hypothetical protein